MPSDPKAPLIDATSTHLAKNRATLLLGSDEQIAHETRVGLTPAHLAPLVKRLSAAGVALDVLVLRGAGARAGFLDADYRAAGAELVDEAALGARPAVDVVHALKEPTAYESRLPGPFLRIGAVHLATKPSGVCAMLAQRNFAAIIDGGTVGNCSYLLDGGDRTPIVGSMSRFAGWVAAEKVVEGVRRRHPQGKVIVIGGGIAGTSAAEKLLAIAGEIVVIERYAPIHDRIRAQLVACGFRTDAVRILEHLDDQVFDHAIAIVFAHRSGARAAEKVCSLAQIERLEPGAGIADIAIDQGGSILHDGYSEDDDATTARAKYIELFAGRFFYYAEVNMPRERPRKASRMHGDAVLPYLEALLLMCALHGGPTAACAELRRLPPHRYSDAREFAGLSRFDCLKRDLRNGLQLAIKDGRVDVVDADIAADRALRRWIDGCAAAGATGS